MSKDNDSFISGLIAAGVLLAIGYGIYRVLKSFGEFAEGEEIYREDLSRSKSAYTMAQAESSSYCPECGTSNPERCSNGHCMICALQSELVEMEDAIVAIALSVMGGLVEMNATHAIRVLKAISVNTGSGQANKLIIR